MLTEETKDWLVGACVPLGIITVVVGWLALAFLVHPLFLTLPLVLLLAAYLYGSAQDVGRNIRGR